MKATSTAKTHASIEVKGNCEVKIIPFQFLGRIIVSFEPLNRNLYFKLVPANGGYDTHPTNP
jgi:hypothetical protein